MLCRYMILVVTALMLLAGNGDAQRLKVRRLMSSKSGSKKSKGSRKSGDKPKSVKGSTKKEKKSRKKKSEKEKKGSKISKTTTFTPAPTINVNPTVSPTCLECDDLKPSPLAFSQSRGSN